MAAVYLVSKGGTDLRSPINADWCCVGVDNPGGKCRIRPAPFRMTHAELMATAAKMQQRRAEEGLYRDARRMAASMMRAM